MTCLCSLSFLSFDRGSKIFFLVKNLNSNMIGQLVSLAFVGMTGNWLATISYQLIDPTICSVIKAQEIIWAYIAQAIAFNLIPCYVNFIGSALVILSAICMPLEKIVVPKFPYRLRMIC